MKTPNTPNTPNTPENKAWEYLNEYISRQYSDCSSLPELCDGFGVRKDGQKKEIWEVVRDGLMEYDKEMGIEP